MELQIMIYSVLLIVLGIGIGISFKKHEIAQKYPQQFIEINVEYEPEDRCSYEEYKGKPYYSITYKQNGYEYEGFGTYNPEVLSRYLREYFCISEDEKR